MVPEVKLDGSTGHVCDLIYLQGTELFVVIVPGKNWEWGECLPQVKIAPFSNHLCTQLLKSLMKRLIFHRFPLQLS